MNWFNFDLRKTFWLAVVILVPLVSINTQKTPYDTGWYNRPFYFLAASFESGFFSFADSVRGTVRLYVQLIGIKKENQDLKSLTQLLQTRLQTFEELQRENERLQKLVEFRTSHKMDLIAAQIMSRDLLEDHASIQINKGTQHGLQQGQAVISTEGVVGHVFRPEAFTSHVLLISDRFSVVDGRVSRSRARGIVEGKGQNDCSLQYVEKSEDVKVGDLIVTTGLDNIFPKGFPIARVESIENKPYLVSLRVDLQPVVDPKKIEEVFVITNANHVDLSSQQAAANADQEKPSL